MLETVSVHLTEDQIDNLISILEPWCNQVDDPEAESTLKKLRRAKEHFPHDP